MFAEYRRPDGASNTLALFTSGDVKITAERRSGEHFVRIYRAGQQTYQRECQSDRQAREKCERVAEAWTNGEDLSTI